MAREVSINPAVTGVNQNLEHGTSSYRQILKSTTFVGGAQVITIFFGIIRNKLLAVYLGPAGVGLVGLLSSVTSLVGTITGLGIPMSGVQQIAASVGRNDERGIGVTVATLKLITWIAGLVGMCLVVAFAEQIAGITFGDRKYAWDLRIVSVVILLDGIAAKQKAVLQGLRRIKELSICQAIGAVGCTLAAVPIIIIFRESGVAGFLVAASLCGMLACWWFERKLRVERIKLASQEFNSTLKSLMNVGLAFVIMGVLGALIMYLARLLVAKELGLGTVGLYQATLTLSTVYVGIVLNAMGTDYFPRLTGIANDRVACNRLINEQTEMGLLIVFPGVLGTLVLAQRVLQAIYSPEFMAATDVLRWQILGDALKVVSWPLGFITLAQGRGKLFVIVEASFAVLQLALLYVCVAWRQFEGAGIAFFLYYLAYTVGIYFVARTLTGFSWTDRCRKSLFIVTAASGGVFLLCRYVDARVSMPVGFVCTLLAILWSFKRLQKLMGKDFFPGIYRKYLGRFSRNNGISQQP